MNKPKRQGATKKKFAQPGPGQFIVAHLRDPREKIWGMLLAMDAAGAWIRGIDVRSFGDWARDSRDGSPDTMGPSTVFFPYLRVDKLVLDEPVGGTPSMVQDFERISGKSLSEILES